MPICRLPATPPPCAVLVDPHDGGATIAAAEDEVVPSPDRDVAIDVEHHAALRRIRVTARHRAEVAPSARESVTGPEFAKSRTTELNRIWSNPTEGSPAAPVAPAWVLYELSALIAASEEHLTPRLPLCAGRREHRARVDDGRNNWRPLSRAQGAAAVGQLVMQALIAAITAGSIEVAPPVPAPPVADLPPVVAIAPPVAFTPPLPERMPPVPPAAASAPPVPF